MKRFLLYATLFLSSVAGAQIINFPDANFKALLISSSGENSIALNNNGAAIAIDSNSDGEIEQSEALLVYELNVSESNVTSLIGLEFFTNLTLLDCGDGTNLGSLIIPELPNLTHLACVNAQLNSIDISAAQNLTWLNCNYNFLTSIDISNNPSMETFACSDNQITYLDVTGATNLQVLSCSNNNMETLNVAGLQYLQLIDCSNNELETLNLSNLEALSSFYASFNPFTTIVLSGLTNLKSFDLNVTDITELDLSDSPLLEYFQLVDTYVETVNIKNGGILAYPLECNIQLNPYLTHICVDEGEEDVLLQYFEANDLEPIPMTTDCPSGNPGEYNSVTGQILFDWAANGCDENDAPGSYIKVNLSGDGINRSRYTDVAGNYHHYAEAGDFTLTPETENAYFIFEPASININFPEMDGSSQVYNFCLTPDGVHNDIEVLIAPVTNARPGFDADYKIIYKNKGNQSLSGSVDLAFQDNVLDLISASPEADSSSAGSLQWNFADLLPFETREVYIIFNVNTPLEDPAVNNGDILDFTVTAAYEGTDETPEDNSFVFNQVVVGSLDPNSIECLEGETEAVEAIGNYLHYVINFENIGTENAEFVVITNEIDVTKYDINTLEILSSSHSVETTVEGGFIEFRFDDIDLAPEVYANVIYKIKTLNTLSSGDTVANDAVIVFDFNEPIATNEFVTVFEELAGVGDYEFDNTVKVYPNPVKDNLNITAGHDLESIELHDLQGRLLQTILVKGTEATLNLSGRAAGIYLVKVTTEKGVKIEKIINE